MVKPFACYKNMKIYRYN